MASGREVTEVIKRLRWKLTEVFEKDAEGFCDELQSQGLITLDEKIHLQQDEDPGGRVEKMISIVLQKEELCEKFLCHLENMIPRFPALSDVLQHFPEHKMKIFHELLVRLNMEHSFYSKLTLSHILEIGAETLSDLHPQTIQDVPWHFLRKLMALNRTAINSQCEKNTQINVDENTSIFGSSMIAEKMDLTESIHPLDVLCVLLHCSDSFLQQEIVSKLSMCQFAVPLLLPSGDRSHCTLMLWAMRDIVKKWRPQSLVNSKGFSEENVVNISMPIFSFIRLGDTKLSKSKILNQVLNQGQGLQNIFIHDDMEGGNIERRISDGLVEMSWYFPCGKSDVFQEPIAVTNLRGDLETNMNQFTFLTRVSSAVFIFIESISEIQFRLLSSLSNADTQFYLIVTPEKGTKINNEHINILKKILNLSAANIITKNSRDNDAVLVKKVRKGIENVLKHCQKQRQNLCNTKTNIEGLHISVDENSVECQKVKEIASQIISKVNNVEVYKKETLQLQGDLWKELSKVEKELCRMAKQGEKEPQEYQSELKQQIRSLHEKQYKHDIPVGILDFTAAITDLSKSEKHYFLKWMKFELDSVARDYISFLQAEYKEKCNSKSDIFELKQLDQKISDSSLGIEHFLRELGQFYEAEYSTVVNKQNNKTTRQFTKLPGIAADLLLDGFPLELIDGDASNIPLQWITDVLTELDNKTGGRCKMRVITVLGVQSTGKSTLLNTMFGLQFPVASGRCTRGAFMTLLKVKENFQKDLGCHFILVIDTEGLKAPELASLDDSYEHDNELATLVVGLSDITIINMSMENTSEMKDILQIVVHAFLRMKEIGRKPSCQFVHQNVSDVSAHEKNMRDRKKFLEQLDEMTRVAAKMENKHGVTCFSDVMDYDPEKHNWYISGLWQGVPPMASVNFGYSENVYELKKHLLGFLKSQNSNRTQYKIPDFIIWIKSLWKAVKHEKFIFSFRNSLVAEAYTKLSMQYSLWEWDFAKNIHSWMITKETYIRNQSSASLSPEMYMQFKVDLQRLLLEEEDTMLKLLETYFDSKCENVHLIERYKQEFLMSVSFLKKELERITISKLDKAVSIQKGKFKILDIQKTSQKLIEEEITNLLKSCRERNCELGDINVEKEFEEIWQKTLSDLQIDALTRRNIGQIILQRLKNEMGVKGGGINENLTKVMSLDGYGNNSFHPEKIHINKVYDSQGQNEFDISQEHLDKIGDLAMTLIDMCDTYINEQAGNTGDYDDTYFQELLHMINDKLKDKTSTHLDFSPRFELDIKLFIFGKASRAFQGIHDRFIQENDPKMCLEKLKPQYLATFDKKKNRTETFCEHCLKPAITEYILGHIGEEIIGDILQGSDRHIFCIRSAFQAIVLEDLLEKMEFEQYLLYINNYRVFVKRWIHHYIIKKYQSTSTLKALEEKLLLPIIEKIEDVLKNEECLKSESIVTFLESFCKLLDKEIVISQNEITVITFHNTANVSQFSEDILQYLPNIKEQILSDTELLDIERLLSRVTLKPHEELMHKMIGCGNQCPFCKVPCDRAGSFHKEHAASLHRPRGLVGYKSDIDGTLVTDICSTAVVSNTRFTNSDTDGEFYPHKDYRKYYPDWVIQPDPSLESSDYWKYIFVHFNNKFAEEHFAKPAELPQDWMEITKEQAHVSLLETFVHELNRALFLTLTCALLKLLI